MALYTFDIEKVRVRVTMEAETAEAAQKALMIACFQREPMDPETLQETLHKACGAEVTAIFLPDWPKVASPPTAEDR